MSSYDKWIEFEWRKQQLKLAGLSPAEYEAAIRTLLRELGL